MAGIPSTRPESTFYSQFGEDQILARLFSDTEMGTCVEVGAHNGVQLSNTYYFEQIGWRCVLVEPAPHLCAAIRKHRRSPVFECAASEREGQAILHTVEGADVYSTLKETGGPDRAASEGDKTQGTPVRTRRLDDILVEARVDRIEFISIDVEGHEMSVLRGFSIERWKPRIAIIEDNSDLSDDSVARFLRDRGYVRFYRTGVNDWYAAPSERKLRNLLHLVLSREWGVKGLVKAWSPVPVLRLVAFLRSFRLAGANS
jgi:FkbM family methyltransferase